MPQTLSLIAAVAQNGVIGIRNTLPWRLPEDLRYFKQLTLGHPIIMGRKTYESLGRPLPNRTNIILTRDMLFQTENCLIAHDIPEAISLCAEEDEIFVIGGAQIYQQAMSYAQRLYLTEVKLDIAEGDAWFPEVDTRLWHEISRQTHHNEQCHYAFVVYERR
uniref:dihydrofolate reductase n=1 Tax=mine drainage metagenome TaxID=410659 RepID=E6QX68_9ZZZZ